MIERKANTYRLYPTPEQAQQMAQIAGSCRYVFNLALEQRRDWWKPGRTFNFASQCREVTMLRAEVDWLKAAPVHTLQQALKDLDRAYQNWWAGRADYPTPRKKGLNDSFRFPDPVSIRVERTGNSSGRIKLPKLGWVRLRGWYAIPGSICNATVSRRAGLWHVAVQWQREVAEPVASILPAVGIDRGVAVFAALSNGANVAPVNHGKKALRALRKAQRNLSRKKRGSSNRRKAIRRVAKIQMRVANARKNFLHDQTTTIANNHGTVVCGGVEGAEHVRIREGHRSRTGQDGPAKGGSEPGHSGSGLGRLQDHAGLQTGGSWWQADRSSGRLHQPDMRRMRRGGCAKPTGSGTVRLHGLRPRSQRGHQRGDRYSTTGAGQVLEVCGRAPR